MICIYSKTNTDFDHNGDAVLIPTSCKLSATINGAWQLTLEHPYDPEERYKYLVEDAIIVADIKFIRELSTTRQKFRIYNYVKGLHSVKVIAFPIAMESTYDAPIDNMVISGKTGVQAMAQLQTKTNKYTLSTDITRTGYTSFANTNINSAIASGDDGCFIKVWGGEILYDNLTFAVKDRLGDNVASSHKVTYGHNLTDIEYKKDDSGLTTRIYPISQDGIRLNGSGYVDSSHISDYPVPHSKFMTAPYNLVDSKADSGTQTAALTQQAVSAVSAQASSLSQSVYNTQISNGYQPEYIKTIKDSIISAVQTMALANVVSTSLYNLMASTIKSAMDWMKDLKQPKWDWMGSYESGWRYGNSTSYAKNMYVKISKTWSYFGSNGYWQEPRDNSNEWDWFQKNSSSGKKYGDFSKYYAHNEYVYITRDGQIYEYWFNEDGWYEDDESGASDYYWHGSGTSADPYWFGDGNGNYLKSCWRFIDGDYCFFDSFGYCSWTSDTRRQNWPWDWNDSGDADRAWFGNPNNKEMGAEYLFSQWAKINGSWYYFDSNGYVETEAVSETRTVTAYTTGMAGLQTTVDSWKSQLYTLLYQLMTAYANSQFAEGVDLPAVTITVKMADLKNTTEYEDFKHLEEIKLGDSVLCTDTEHNITTESRIVGIVYDILRDYNETITIGTASATVQQMIGNAGGEAVAGGFDTTAIENQLTALRNGKQDKLTAGENITIENNVISSTAGTAGLEYWDETSEHIERAVVVPVEDDWTANSNYLFSDDDASFTYDSRTYYRKNTGTGAQYRAVCGWAVVNNWVEPIYLSTNPDAVEMVADGHDETYSGTLTYSGLTFYTSPTEWMLPYEEGVLPTTDLLYIGNFSASGDNRIAYLQACNELIRLSNLRTTDSFRTGISVKDDYCFYGGYSVEEEPDITDLPFWVDTIGRVNGSDFLQDGVSILQRYVKDVKVNGTSIVLDQIANLQDFTGATSSADGAPGLVPAPTTEEKNYFLRADGTWQPAGSEHASDIFSIFDTTAICSQYSSGSLANNTFTFSVDEYEDWWSASATAYNDIAYDLTGVEKLRISIMVTDQADDGLFWVTLSQTKYTWGDSEWVSVYNNVDSALEISESGSYDIDVSSLSGNYYIYIGASTGKDSTTHGYCDNTKNGTMTGVVTGFDAITSGGGGTSDYDDLSNKPQINSHTLSGNQSAADLGFSTVATSGSYNDLTNKPTIPAAQVNSDWDASSGVAQILNKPTLATVATSGSYNDLSNTPTLATVATTGDYDDLLDKPNLATVATSGSYNDLTNKPTIPDAQVQSNWTESDSTKVDYIKNKPTLATVATSGSYNDLTNKPTIPAAQVQADWSESDNTKVDFIKNKPNLATVATSGSYNDLSNKPNLSTVATSGSYNDLSNKPTIPSVEANPSGSGSTDLTKLEVDGTIYNIPSGGGSSLPLVVQNGKLCIVYET